MSVAKIRFSVQEYGRIHQLVCDGYLDRLGPAEYSVTPKGVAVLMAEAERPLAKPGTRAAG
jgi:predicted transcriptional regulator